MSRELSDLGKYHFDGRSVLQDILQTSVYETIPQAVASLTKFSHPATVAQTNNCNIFRVIRWSNTGEVDDNGNAIKRGGYVAYGENGRVMLDDNESPTSAFVWASGSVLKGYKDVQFNHIWAGAKDVTLYTSLANICVAPAFLAKLTDTDKEVCASLQYRAYELYCGFRPRDKPVPAKPKGYNDLAWAPPLPEVDDLEACLRRAVQTKPKNRAVCSIQELGWYFSDFKPEPTVKIE